MSAVENSAATPKEANSSGICLHLHYPVVDSEAKVGDQSPRLVGRHQTLRNDLDQIERKRRATPGPSANRCQR